MAQSRASQGALTRRGPKGIALVKAPRMQGRLVGRGLRGRLLASTCQNHPRTPLAGAAAGPAVGGWPHTPDLHPSHRT